MVTTIIIIVVVVALAVAAILYLKRDSIRGRPVPEILKPGNPLPEFQVADEAGNPRFSSELRGTPAVILFVRGTWCPFCSRQVEDLTKHYKDITEAGARLILITSKPLDTTRRVADLFGVDFEFWIDESFLVVRQLGLFLEGGVPGKHRQEFGTDTVWPASLVVDALGTIRYSEVSRFIADRPNSELLLAKIKAI